MTADTAASASSKPKRPLSAYNLFYRFKRSALLVVHESGDECKETILRIIAALPGLEGEAFPEDVAPEVRRERIRGALVENLSPKDSSKRTHRKSHGAMSFLEMNKAMCTSWKSIDDFARGVFEELADEGRRVYHKKVAEYEDRVAARGGAIATKKKFDELSSADGTPSASASGGPRTLARKVSVDGQWKDAVVVKSDDEEAPAEKPKRPLSSYNVFYRYKRSKIQEAHEKGDYSGDTSSRLIKAVPGLEDYPSIPADLSSEDGVRELREKKIRDLMEGNLSPKDTTKRTHRKSHGMMSFLEMNRIMCDSWKAIDDFSRGIFEELADQGRRVYLKKLAKYEAQNPTEGDATPPPKKKAKVAMPEPKNFGGIPDNKFMGNFLQAPEMTMNPFDAGAGFSAPGMPHPVSPTGVESMPPLGMEGLPFFPDVFDDDDDQGNTSTSSGEYQDNGFPHFPFSQAEEMEQQEVYAPRVVEPSADDFLRLIATLEGN